MNKRIKFKELETGSIKINLKLTFIEQMSAKQRSQIIIIINLCHKIEFFESFLFLNFVESQIKLEWAFL